VFIFTDILNIWVNGSLDQLGKVTTHLTLYTVSMLAKERHPRVETVAD